MQSHLWNLQNKKFQKHTAKSREEIWEWHFASSHLQLGRSEHRDCAFVGYKIQTLMILQTLLTSVLQKLHYYNIEIKFWDIYLEPDSSYTLLSHSMRSSAEPYLCITELQKTKFPNPNHRTKKLKQRLQTSDLKNKLFLVNKTKEILLLLLLTLASMVVFLLS